MVKIDVREESDDLFQFGKFQDQLLLTDTFEEYRGARPIARTFDRQHLAGSKQLMLNTHACYNLLHGCRFFQRLALVFRLIDRTLHITTPIDVHSPNKLSTWTDLVIGW